MTVNTRDLKYIDELLVRGHWFQAGQLLNWYLSGITPYGGIPFWVTLQERENAKKKSLAQAFKAIQDELFAVHETMDANKLELFLKGEKGYLKTFGDYKNTTGKNIRLKMTSSQLIKRWMELQDTTLLPTFKYNMHFTEEMIHALTNLISKDELKVAEWMLNEFYPGHMTGKYDGISIDKVYGDVYNIFLTSLLGFIGQMPNPQRNRTPYDICYSYVEIENGEEEWAGDDDLLEESIPDGDEDNDMPVCDKEMVLPRLIKSYMRIGAQGRIKLIKPLKLIGVYESIQKYIIEIENFKAFSELRREANALFGDNDVRKAIQQYHGPQILVLLDKFLDCFYKSGSIESQHYEENCLVSKNWQ